MVGIRWRMIARELILETLWVLIESIMTVSKVNRYRMLDEWKYHAMVSWFGKIMDTQPAAGVIKRVSSRWWNPLD